MKLAGFAFSFCYMHSEDQTLVVSLGGTNQSPSPGPGRAQEMLTRQTIGEIRITKPCIEVASKWLCAGATQDHLGHLSGLVFYIVKVLD